MLPEEALASIDATLKAILKALTKNQPKESAPASDLDGKYGDPELKFLPRDWTGHDYRGNRFSECPADLLDMVAKTLDYFGDKAEAANELTSSGKPVATFKRMDAARARGWAERARGGRTQTKAAPQGETPQWASGSDTDDQPDIPF